MAGSPLPDYMTRCRPEPKQAQHFRKVRGMSNAIEPVSVFPKATRRDWIGLAVIAMPCLLYSMDLTVLHLAMPQIARDLSPSAAQQLWIVDIYGFLIAGSLLTMGTLGDRIGRRRLLMIGAAAFGLTSLLAAFSQTPQMLIVARALQGLAGATLAPSTLSLIRNMFLDPQERTFAIGVWVAAFSAGGALGPVFGGLILDHFWWGAVFLLNVPLMMVLLVLAPILLPEYKDPNAGRLDLVSVAQSLTAVLAIIYGMKHIAEDGVAWQPFAFIAGGVLLGWFFVRRQKTLADPLIDVRLFQRTTFTTALVVNVLGLFTVLGTFFFIAQYLQLVEGLSPLQAGLWLAPSGIAFAAGSMLAPVLVRYHTHGIVVAWGFLIAAIGFAILTQLSRTEGSLLLFAGMIVFCIGLAPIGALTTDLVVSAAPPERAGAASGISETSFEFGGALGIAVLGSIITALYRVMMAATPDVAGMPAEAMEAARGTLSGAITAAQALPQAVSPADAARLVADARAAFVDAFEITSGIAAVCALLAAVLSAWLLRHARANAHY